MVLGASRRHDTEAIGSCFPMLRFSCVLKKACRRNDTPVVVVLNTIKEDVRARGAGGARAIRTRQRGTAVVERPGERNGAERPDSPRSRCNRKCFQRVVLVDIDASRPLDVHRLQSIHHPHTRH